MDLTFTKMEGIGNDFIFIDDRNGLIEKNTPYSTLAESLCHRRFGIGADGIILILNSPACDLGFRIFNSDGSEAEMCGNGMRCMARLVYESGMIDKTQFTVDTRAGVIIPKINFDDKCRFESVTVDMGEPVLDPKKIPFKAGNNNSLTETVTTELGEVTFTAVSMGNPHAVIFVDDISKAPVSELGPVMEHHPLFPEKTNVEFIQVLSDTELRMRVWERGAGITLACGTGACASVVAAILNKKTKDEVLIHLDGGDLTIRWDNVSNHIFKTGPAQKVFQGHIHLD